MQLILLFVGGLLLDFCGGKVTVVCSLFVATAGWALIAFSSESFNAYYAGAVLVGMGADPSFFCCMDIANLFPGYTSTIIGLMGSARSIAMLWALALRGLPWDPQGNLLFWTALQLFWLIVMPFVVPWRPYSQKPNEESSVDEGGTLVDFDNFQLDGGVIIRDGTIVEEEITKKKKKKKKKKKSTLR
eukprot:Trichotokara_eunicae@DN4159_c0_g1_i2.p1